MKRILTAVLGSSGLVAQRLQQRLVHHPWFELAAVAGSPQRLGQPVDVLPWRLEDGRPELPNLSVMALDDEAAIARLAQAGVQIAFSALPADIASTVEPLWASHGIAVFSNASAFRRVKGVPLVVPEVNPQHLLALEGRNDRIACATNCTLLPLLLPLAALNAAFGLNAWVMRSEQALSGGGYGLIDSVRETGTVPNEILGEAEKTEAEFRHVLGWNGHAELSCKRVNRLDGHHVFVEATLGHRASVEDVQDAIAQWSHRSTPSHLPSAPARSMMVVECVDPEAHLLADGETFPKSSDPTTNLKTGMAVVVGNIVTTGSKVTFQALSHNTLRGAAGGTVYLAELAVDLGLFGPTQAQG